MDGHNSASFVEGFVQQLSYTKSAGWDGPQVMSKYFHECFSFQEVTSYPFVPSSDARRP